MKKNLFFTILFCTTASVSAQSEGKVGINTVTPSAALHVKSKGNTVTTQALKVDNTDGTNLLTINNDGTVSGVAAVNLSAGTPGTPKASGLFSGMTPAPSEGYLSPVGNGFAASLETVNAAAFYTVAQTVPFDTVLDHLTFSLLSRTMYFSQQPIIAELYVNGQPTGLSAWFYDPYVFPGLPATSSATMVSVSLHRGDIFAYRIRGFNSPEINMYITVRYTEQ